MDLLPNALSKAYNILWQFFKTNDFTRLEAIDALTKENPKLYDEIYVNTITYKLENVGVLIKDWGISSLDKRRSVYRLVSPEDFTKAKELSRNFTETIIPGIPFTRIVDSLWYYVLGHLEHKINISSFPQNLSEVLDHVVSGEASRSKDLQIAKKFDHSGLSKDEAKNIEEILKLFDASGNYYRSITNVYLEFKGMEKRIETGEFDFPIIEFLSIDGASIKTEKITKNRNLCPICLRYPQGPQAQALITGQPKTDSRYQLYVESRSQMKACKWCFLSGYIDLPLATIRKEGQTITKFKEYIYINSPLTREEIETIINRAKGAYPETIKEEELAGEEDPLIADLTDGEKKRFQDFAVLGTRKGLVRIEGFVLPFQFDFARTVGISFPFEQLVGEKVSGFVKEKLIAATLYEIYELTKGEVHYGCIGKGNISIFGRTIGIKKAKKANQIYEVCNKNRIDFRFNSRIFEMFFFEPNVVINGILRRFFKMDHPPGEKKIKEVIEMVETLSQKDWVFKLGQEMVEYLIDNKLLQWAKSFYRPGGDTWSGVELVKWLQNFKMVRDDDSLREWCTRVIYTLKKEELAYQENIGRLMELSKKIMNECKTHNTSLGDFSRRIADMDLYLLFSYTHDEKKERRHKEKIEEANRKKELKLKAE